MQTRYDTASQQKIHHETSLLGSGAMAQRRTQRSQLQMTDYSSRLLITNFNDQMLDVLPPPRQPDSLTQACKIRRVPRIRKIRQVRAKVPIDPMQVRRARDLVCPPLPGSIRPAPYLKSLREEDTHPNISDQPSRTDQCRRV